jgi:hypothetical protein
MHIDRRTVLDLFFVKVDVQNFFVMIQLAERMRRQKDETARQPGSGVRNEIANHPVLIVKVEIFHMAHFAIQRRKGVVVDLFYAL